MAILNFLMASMPNIFKNLTKLAKFLSWAYDEHWRDSLFIKENAQFDSSSIV